MSEEKNLRNKTVRSLSGIAVIQLAKRGLGLFVSILLYRFLNKNDFGVFALCESVLMFAMIFSDMGTEDAVIQTKAEDQETLILTGYWMRFFFTMLTAGVVFGLTPQISNWLNSGLLVSPIRISVLTLFTSLICFHFEISIKKGVRFEKLLIPEITAQMISTLLSLFLAYRGWGYWSLILSGLLSQFFRALILTWQAKHLGRFFVFSPELARKMLPKCLYSVTITFLYYALSRSVQFFVADKFDVASVGAFYMAFNWANFFVTYGVQLFGRVVFPAVAQIHQDVPRVTKAYHEYLHRVILLAVPFHGVLAVTADNLIPLLIGNKWESSIWLCQILCLHGFFRSLASPAQTVLYGLGEFPKICIMLTIEVMVFAGLCFSFQSLGLKGLCWALVLSKALGFLMPTLWIENLLKVKQRIHTLLPPYLWAALPMFGAMYLISLLTQHVALPKIAIVMLQIATGLGGYLLGHLCFHGGNLHHLTSIRSDFKRMFKS